MESDKTISFPASEWIRASNKLGPRVVPDEISSQMLVFEEPFDTRMPSVGAAVFVDVMSDADTGEGKLDRKLCRLLIPPGELRRIVDMLEAEFGANVAR